MCTTKRMMDDYFDRFYNKLAERSKLLRLNNYAKAKEIVEWKEHTASNWDSFAVKHIEFNPNQKMNINNDNKEIYGKVVIDRKNLKCDLAVECVVVDIYPTSKTPQFVESYDFELVKTEGSLLHFESSKALNDPGSHQYGLRVYPKNPALPHRMDFAYTRWI